MSNDEDNYPTETKAMPVTSRNILDRTKSRYEYGYQHFKNWCLIKDVKSASENVLLRYFLEIAENRNSATMWATYSMLKRTLISKEAVDISKYTKLIAYLKKYRQDKPHHANRSMIFTMENIENFLDNAPIDFLPQKVGLIVGISGSCRSDELVRMTIRDIHVTDNKIIISIPELTGQRRVFNICNFKWIQIFMQYWNYRLKVSGDRLFVQLRGGKLTRQPYGHNSIERFPKKIATFLQLKDATKYTGHCFRRTATNIQ